jgi:hypothetical protein
LGEAQLPQIETNSELGAWLYDQDQEIRTSFVARAALRTLPAVFDLAGINNPGSADQALLISGLRAVITAVAFGVSSPDHIRRLVRAANEALSTVGSHTEKEFGYGRSNPASGYEALAVQALLSAQSAAQVAASASEYPLNQIEDRDLSTYMPWVFSDAHLMIGWLSSTTEISSASRLLEHPLWLDGSNTTNLHEMWRRFRRTVSDKSVWAFWRDWYQGFLDGKPLDWEVQRRVALIDDAIWEQGPEAVAEEIKRIKGEFATQRQKKPRFSAFEPNDLRPLIQNRIVATASLQGLAVQISGAIEQYHTDTGANALPEALSPLQDMPALMNAIAATLGDIRQPDDVSPESEQDLREEVGRLNAKVAELEKKLDKAQSAKPSPFTDALKKQLGSSLGDWKLYAAICGTALMLNSDDGTLRHGWENLIKIRQEIFGDASSPPQTNAPVPTPSDDSFEI